MLPKLHEDDDAPGASAVVHVGSAIAEAEPAVAPASAAAATRPTPIRLTVEALLICLPLRSLLRTAAEATAPAAGVQPGTGALRRRGRDASCSRSRRGARRTGADIRGRRPWCRCRRACCL